MELTPHIPIAVHVKNNDNLKHTVHYKGTEIVIDGLPPTNLPLSTKVQEFQLTAEEKKTKRTV